MNDQSDLFWIKGFALMNESFISRRKFLLLDTDAFAAFFHGYSCFFWLLLYFSFLILTLQLFFQFFFLFFCIAFHLFSYCEWFFIQNYSNPHTKGSFILEREATLNCGFEYFLNERYSKWPTFFVSPPFHWPPILLAGFSFSTS